MSAGKVLHKRNFMRTQTLKNWREHCLLVMRVLELQKFLDLIRLKNRYKLNTDDITLFALHRCKELLIGAFKIRGSF